METNKIYKVFMLLGIFSLAISCNSNDEYSKGLEAMDFGESVYFEPFLWVKSDTIILTKELKFDFSDYAVSENASLELQFVDSENNKLNLDQINIFDDGILVSDGIIRVKAIDKSVTKKIGIQFMPSQNSGNQNGFLAITSHDFDRIDNFDDNDLNQDQRIKRWSAYFEKDYNPLALGIFWFLVLVSSFLVLWFLVIRNILYPKFKKGKIQILAPYYGGFNIGGSIKQVIFTNKPQKQKTLNKIFTGVIKYEVNPIFESDITLRPGRKNKIKIKLPIGSKISPPVVNLEKLNKYKIEVKKQIIEIQYS